MRSQIFARERNQGQVAKKKMMEIQPADPTARLAALLAVGTGGSLALVVGYFATAFPEITSSIKNALTGFFEASPNLLPVAGGIGVLPVIFVSIVLYAFGNRIVRAKRFPLPGQKVVRNTRIRQGEAAITHARRLQTLSVALILTCAAIPILLAGIVRSLTATS